MTAPLPLLVASVLSGATPSAPQDAPPQTVECAEPALRFRDGRDVYTIWNGDISVAGGCARISQKGRVAWFNYTAFPGPEPFCGADEIVVRTSEAWDGAVTLYITDITTGETRVERSAPWRTETRIPCGFPADHLLQITSISFWKADPDPNAEIVFDVLGVESVVRRAPVDAIRLDFDVGNPFRIVTNAAQRVALVVSNPSRERIRWTGGVELRDGTGRTALVPVSAEVPAGGSARVPVNASRLAKGVWRTAGTVSCGGVERAVPEARLARVDPHPATPVQPRGRFRMGLNYHMMRYSPVDRELTMDAAVAAGAKLVRCDGFSFARLMPDGPESWEPAASDAVLKELRDHGLALDAIIHSTPRWAAPEDRQSASDWRAWAVARPRPGLFGMFAERLAARYGTLIDYYEIGNEWDLNAPEILNLPDAIALQKEAFEGLKRGNPEVCVIPNGFAAPGDNQQVKMKGFHENFLVACKGFFDVHPIHIHGGFPTYERGILDEFFPMRERTGTEAPWYSNETAMTTTHGAESVAAATVFKKILFARAHGAVDYIWYNLKATGWDPKDPEQGYGVFTADYRPRETFAAFSALSTLYAPLDFERVEREEGGLHAYRFGATRDGRSVAAIGCWDDDARKGPTVLRVRTDAARAAVADLMGNVSPLAVSGGEVAFPVSAAPASLLLQDFTTAELAAVEPFAESAAPDLVVPPGPAAGRAPDIVLSRADQTTDLYAANPETAWRVWRGPDDLSANAWLSLEDGALRIVAEVADDVHSPVSPAERLYEGDSIQFALASPGQRGCWEFGVALGPDGETLAHCWMSPVGFAPLPPPVSGIVARSGGVTRYEVSVPLAALGFSDGDAASGFAFDFMVNENDGAGRDGWMEWSPGIATVKDHSAYPRIAFRPQSK